MKTFGWGTRPWAQTQISVSLERNLGLLQTWEVPGLSSCMKIAGADSWEPGLCGSSQVWEPEVLVQEEPLQR